MNLSTCPDPINGSFLTLLINIFEKKHTLASSKKNERELRQILEDLKRTKKWTESSIRQIEKALEEKSSSPLSLKFLLLKPTFKDRFKKLLNHIHLNS